MHTLLAQPRRFALLVYLLLEAREGYIRRDTLLALFWADSDEARARAALRQALQFLRRTLGGDVLRTRGDDDVGIDASRFEVDAVSLGELRRAGRPGDAVALYQGPFLDGFSLEDAYAFGDWQDRQRLRLRLEAGEAAVDFVEMAEPIGTRRAAARVALDLLPLDQRAIARVAAALVAAGDSTGAAEVLRDGRERIRVELGVDADLPTVGSLIGVRDVGRAAVAVLAPPGATRPPAPADEPDSGGAPAHTAPSSRHGTRYVAIGVLAAVVLAAAWGLTGWRPGSASPAATARVMVVPFDNQSGDTTLAPVGIMAADWIVEGLSRVEGLAVIPYTAVAAGGSSRAIAATREPGDLARFAAEYGATVVVRGTVYRSGATVHLQSQTLAFPGATMLGPAETVSVAVDSIVPAIDRLRQRVVARFAPLADTVSHLRLALSPPSYGAYRDYVMGLEAFVQGDPRAALGHFARSAAVDTGYPMPRIAAAMMHLNLGEADSAARLVDGLRVARDRLGPFERATLDMAAGILANDPRQVDVAVREQARIAPGTIGHYMVAEVARRLGRPREAIRVLRELGADRGELRGWQPYWRELTGAHHMLGEHAQELAAAREAVRRFPALESPRRFEMRALAALGHVRAIDSLLNAASGDPGTGELLHIAANGLIARGDSAAGQQLRQRELAWYSRHAEGAGRSRGERWRHARVLLLTGRTAEARAILRTLHGEQASVPVVGLAGVAARVAGDTSEALALERELIAIDNARSLAGRAVAEADVAWWRAAMAASAADRERAAEILRAAFAGWGGHVPAVQADPWLGPVARDPAWRDFFSYR